MVAHRTVHGGAERGLVEAPRVGDAVGGRRQVTWWAILVAIGSDGGAIRIMDQRGARWRSRCETRRE